MGSGSVFSRFALAMGELDYPWHGRSRRMHPTNPKCLDPPPQRGAMAARVRVEHALPRPRRRRGEPIELIESKPRKIIFSLVDPRPKKTAFVTAIKALFERFIL